MDKEKENAIISVTNTIDVKPLEEGNVELIKQVLSESNLDKVKDLTHLFNANIAKKNMIRVLQLNELLDCVNDQAFKRLTNRPDNLSNKELMDFMSVLYTSIEKSNKSIDIIDEVPPIQVNNQKNEVNINVTQNLDRDSKTNVIEAIKMILNNSNNNNVMDEDDVIDVEYQEELN